MTRYAATASTRRELRLEEEPMEPTAWDRSQPAVPDLQYVRIRDEKRLSWHVVLTPTRMFDAYRVMCGRTIVTKDVRDDLPSGPSCESCFRAVARRAEG